MLCDLLRCKWILFHYVCFTCSFELFHTDVTSLPAQLVFSSDLIPRGSECSLIHAECESIGYCKFSRDQPLVKLFN